MSKEIFLSQTFGLQDKNDDGQLTGKFEGVANSGQPVKEHWGIQNLITDIESLSFKEQIPIFLNHWAEHIVGFASLEIKDNQLWVTGQISKSTEHGKQVLALASEGFKWELSIGVSGNYEDIRETAVSVNGYDSPVPSTIIRQGKVFEVSFCPIGADDQTFVNVFKKPINKKGDMVMSKKVEFSAAEWAKFACSCGGTAESTLAELEEVIVDSEDLKEIEEEKTALELENEALKKEIEELKAKLEEIEAADIEEEVAEMSKKKGLELSSEELKDYASNKEKAKMFLEMASKLKDVKPKIESKFTKPIVVSTTSTVLGSSEREKAEARRKKATELAKEKGISFVEAVGMLPEEDFK